MTGFSSKLVSLDLPKLGKISFSVEIKSVNTRFFEALCKMPSSLSCLEIKIINLLQKKLSRGRVYVTIRFVDTHGALECITHSLSNVKGYVESAKAIQKELNISGTLEISDVLQLSDVFVTTSSELSEQDEKFILDAIGGVADQLMSVRLEEGKQLKLDLEKRFALCKEKILYVEKLSKELMDSIKKDIGQKLVLVEKGDEVAKLQLDDLYMTLNKVDVHEEITRFKGHLQSVENLFTQDKIEKGKRLDFILQELLREVNTTMAKCSHLDISTECVDIKVELEKAREQTQNIV